MTRGKRLALITMRIALILAIILILLVVVFVLLLLRKSYYTEWAEAEQESIWVSEEPKMYFKFNRHIFNYDSIDKFESLSDYEYCVKAYENANLPVGHQEDFGKINDDIPFYFYYEVYRGLTVYNDFNFVVYDPEKTVRVTDPKGLPYDSLHKTAVMTGTFKATKDKMIFYVYYDEIFNGKYKEIVFYKQS